MERNIVDLDVRDILRAKQEPFDIIMKHVKELKENDCLQLHTTFEPAPLLKLMATKGFAHKIEQVEPEHFVVQFYREN
ncbi:DUF2249 domain-containing protein [Effusibacillus lacus]|uniref:Glutamine synthetase n=1 Tax=Effusibacillus lacus TaxID=1348429 RepID=A0A292YKA2_9BACL|nr:DUF2249 domain-containing protein [Effusibacillus lacus]TCS69416.1 uncharacterized protein DUF2249 [Effusibacillus lacus]GAX89183.1 glutamine synthetase [Effusibacillus lacus]